MKGIISYYPPLGKLFMLLGILFIGGIMLQYAALAIVGLLFPAADLQTLFSNAELQASDFTQTQINALKCFQALSSIGQYILCPLFFVYLCGEGLFRTTGLRNQVNVNLYVLAFFIFFSSIGVIGYVNDWNQQIVLPEQFNALQESMRALEDQAEVQTDALLATTNPAGLLLNILIVALLAAVGEEIVFRGLIQNYLQKILRNKHAAVWIAAFIFSFMHFQFFGFFPRLILGAVLGYLFAWSGSLLPSVAGHFINNLMGVMAYYMANTQVIDKDVTEEASWQFALFSLPFFILFLFLYKRAAQNEQLTNGKRLDDDLHHT